ncbi:hypothetical protein PR202_ga24676 [Eleusine coracana subsp. coracana]|uniref:Uncharacterized protein n=1 Tax=Eleusine coracana subsp. coracana TaxID=191504 RepID=A0AAV5D8I8_ELECO|nr:hypothetical protein PR202_ga24676 [Eleusine coracana subsp. coracana]
MQCREHLSLRSGIHVQPRDRVGKALAEGGHAVRQQDHAHLTPAVPSPSLLATDTTSTLSDRPNPNSSS